MQTRKSKMQETENGKATRKKIRKTWGTNREDTKTGKAGTGSQETQDEKEANQRKAKEETQASVHKG